VNETRELVNETLDLEQRFLQILQSKGNDTYTLELTGSESSILHGLLTIAMDHPNMQKMGQVSYLVTSMLRQWCKGVWVNMGLSEEEADLLDQLRGELYDYPHVSDGHIVEQQKIRS